MWNIFSMPWNIFQWSLRKQFILWSASSRSKRNWVSSPKPKLIIAGIVDHICNTNTEETTRQKIQWLFCLSTWRITSQWGILPSKSKVGHCLKTITKIILSLFTCTHMCTSTRIHTLHKHSHTQIHRYVHTHTKHLKR